MELCDAPEKSPATGDTVPGTVLFPLLYSVGIDIACLYRSMQQESGLNELVFH